jgi:predicted transcriptional regulator
MILSNKKNMLHNSRIANIMVVMKGQDVLVLLKLVVIGGREFRIHALARELGISASELSCSIRRSILAGLIDPVDRGCIRPALLEFMLHGFRYVFPVKPGEITRGMPTAHSAPLLKDKIVSKIDFVWPLTGGQVRGQAIKPIYKSVPVAAHNDPILYELLALADAMRVGSTRERNMASEVLEEMIMREIPWT